MYARSTVYAINLTCDLFVYERLDNTDVGADTNLVSGSNSSDAQINSAGDVDYDGSGLVRTYRDIDNGVSIN